MVASRWVWGLLSSAVIFSSANIVTAQELPAPPLLLVQSTQIADDLYQEGLGHYEQKRYEQAISIWQELIEFHEVEKQQESISQIYFYIAQAYRDLEQFNKALQFYEKSLNTARAISHKEREAWALQGMGSIYFNIANYGQALSYWKDSFDLMEQLDNTYGESVLLEGLGFVYERLNQRETALSYYQQSLVLAEEIGRSSINPTTAIGRAYLTLGEYEQARLYLHKSLELTIEKNDLLSQGYALLNLGAVDYLEENFQNSLEYYVKATNIFQEIGHHNGEAHALSGIARNYFELEEYSEALTLWHEALQLQRKLGGRINQAILFSNMGHTLKLQAKPIESIIFYKEAINIFEEIRTDNKALAQSFQDSFTDRISRHYTVLADLLLQQDRILEAQRVLDLLKVQELDDLFDNAQVRSSDSERGIFHRSPEAEFLKRYNDKLREEIALGKEYLALQTRNNSTGLTPAEEDRFLALQARQTDNKNSLTTFLNDPNIQTILAELKDYIEGDNQVFDTEQISQLRNKFKTIQDQGKNAALLYPLILGDRLELVLTTSLTTSIHRTVEISRGELNKLIVAAGKTLKEPNNPDYQALEELYEVLITPIEAALDEAGIETLVYAPDGALRYLPLAALRNANTDQWLIDKYQINNVTALSLTNFGQASPKNLNVLAGAFASGKHDLKVTLSDGQTSGERTFPFSGLTYAGEEVEAISNLARAKTFIDGDFSKALTERFNLHNVIHFATHAQFLPQAPKDSFLVFGNGEYATLREIEAKWGELTNNQLVVLSACETALGTDFTELKETNSGIEILGLGYQLQNKGARAIMASLWQVQDKSTQVLMTEFYQGLSDGQATVEALQQAQQSLSQSAEYSHPHHWASFILIGNGL